MKHYNLFNLRGDPSVTDEDVCDTLGLNPKLAGTPQINEEAIRKMHSQNVQGYVKKGWTREQAVDMANKAADEVRKELKQYK